VKPTLLAGLTMTVIVAAIAGILWGGPAALAAGLFGAVAVAIQLGAIALVKSVQRDQFKLFLQRWGMGMGLRLLGIVAVVIAVGVAHFPAVATATGFLGVLVPLLFFEARVIR
jgi:hypothetical protein